MQLSSQWPSLSTVNCRGILFTSMPHSEVNNPAILSLSRFLPAGLALHEVQSLTGYHRISAALNHVPEVGAGWRGSLPHQHRLLAQKFIIGMQHILASVRLAFRAAQQSVAKPVNCHCRGILFTSMPHSQCAVAGSENSFVRGDEV